MKDGNFSLSGNHPVAEVASVLSELSRNFRENWLLSWTMLSTLFRTRLECLQVTPKDWSSCDRYVCRANLVSRFPRHGTQLLVGVLHEHTAATSSKQSTRCSNPDPHSTRSGPLRENANNAKQRSLVCRTSLVLSGHKIMKKLLRDISSSSKYSSCKLFCKEVPL
ncbi:PREDICTED: uncharacterized protein LOC105144538 isoform X1 [Acromyrmex echinatior]|uniref:uncharacterized protein LOC105144538 isoform X1 n=1 Tax=Acromyrmex echinatior TaxID=103372 RepID=UPI000580D1C1|nr:PREDICTED: uncharacterized protein LOC105144538 isoform X1 [Acromyrmex echinatior]